MLKDHELRIIIRKFFMAIFGNHENGVIPIGEMNSFLKFARYT